MPELGGLEVLAQLKAVSPATRAIVVTQHSDRAYLIGALRLGAKGYLLKRAMGRDVVKALEVVQLGRTYLDPSIADAVVDAALGGGDSDADSELAALTERQRDVLRLTAEGHTAKDVAKRLGISVHTANRHRSNLMERMGVRNRAELVKLAIRLGLTTADTGE